MYCIKFRKTEGVDKYMKHSVIALQIVAIFLLTICVTAGEAQSNNNIMAIGSESKVPSSSNVAPIIDSNRAQMLVPFSQVSKDDFVIDVSAGATEYLDGAVSIPYTNFLKETKLRSKEEISRILRDAGVPCNRTIYIYGKCAPCGGGSAPAEYVYLILKSFGYQVKLLDGTLEQWAASGGRTTGTPSVKPKTNCTPAVKSEGAQRGNQTRNAAGNGSRTEDGFAGTVSAQTVNQNGTLSEDVSYTFEANSTLAQDLNETLRQFENAVNDTMEVTDNSTWNESVDVHSDEYWRNPRHNPFRWRIRLQNYTREGFYGRYGAILRERALSGQPLTEMEMERLNYDWDLVRENQRSVHQEVSFWKLLRGVLFAKQNKQEHSLEISTPNHIHGTRG
jgi:3-mercaptopyruvate sulfurtransferase SseA